MNKKIINIVANVANCNADEFNELTRLSDIDYLDSLDHVFIFLEIEEEFGILIPDDHCNKLSNMTIQEIAEYVQAKISV
jgi:acyl carrier protein